VPICVIGLNHDTAPVEVRERYSLAGEQLSAALQSARGLAEECVILFTCNRLEIYASLGREHDIESLLDRVLGGPPQELRDFLYTHTSSSAAKHLFRVAAGIDSLVLGEVQILGQVQRAWQSAHTAGVAGPVLSQLFHRAVALGKRVQSETSISRLPASVSYAAVVLARRIFGPELAERRVLVIGTGEVGEGVARCLYEQGVRATVVAHRQIERAQVVAHRYQAEMATWDELPERLASTDIVISSTAAPHYILQRRHIEDATRQRPPESRPLYLIDLAVPRDIDPAAGQLPGVHLHNVDDLQAVVRSTLEERRSALPEIEAMVEVETMRFMDWMRARSTAPTIKELQSRAQEVTGSELGWAMSKLPDLTPRERQVVEAMASRIAGKLIHGPIQWLKAQAEASTEPEPDYGMSKLTPAELTELFYRPQTNDE
jgi:glutamyl-tRNA reductase